MTQGVLSRVLTAAAAAFVILAGNAAVAEESEVEHDELVDRMDVPLDIGLVFRADITETRPLKGEGWKGRHLDIRCIEGCDRDVSYREDIFDAPLSIFRLWDGADQIITMWTGATAYWVRIYRVNRTGIRKVFENASKSAPTFTDTPKGEDVVILHHLQYDNEIPITNFATRGEAWKWNGTDYVPMAATKK